MLVRLYLRFEATLKLQYHIPLVWPLCFARLAFVCSKPGKRNAKDGARLRGASQGKYGIHMSPAEDFRQMLRYIMSLLKLNQNLACVALDIPTVICILYIGPKRTLPIHNSSQLSSMNSIASDCNLCKILHGREDTLKRFF